MSKAKAATRKCIECGDEFKPDNQHDASENACSIRCVRRFVIRESALRRQAQRATTVSVQPDHVLFPSLARS